MDEYLALSPMKRFSYRLYRNPLVLFGIGPFLQFVVLQRFNFDEASAAVPDGVIISIAMRPLNDDLVFQTTHVRGNVKYRRIVPAGHARCRPNH